MNIILFHEEPSNGLIKKDDPRCQHILEILKLKEGDSFKMGIVNQSEGFATIAQISDEGVKISYKEEFGILLYPVTLLVAQVRPICMKRILREAVSLGVDRLILTGSDTGEKSYLNSNLYKTGEYKEYLLDGAMQSAHAGIAEVNFENTVDQAVKHLPNDGRTKILLDNVTGSVPLRQIETTKGAVLAIGPERGWTDRERGVLQQGGFKPALLGTRVLRTETACSAGLAVLLSSLGYL